MNTQPSMERAALWYANRQGWHVFPIHNPIFDASGKHTGCTCEHYRRSEECRVNHSYLYLGATGKCANPGKCPRVGWGTKSTVDPDQIRKWWGQPWRNVDVETGEIVYTYPNIGINCDLSNLLVFDADSYKTVCGDLGDLIAPDDRETVTSLTGGGGEHLIYDRQGKPYGNSTRGLPPGVDIRGAGGYIVAARSIHKSGRRYQYENGYAPHEIALRPIPPALERILAAAHPRGDYDGGVGVPCPEGVKRSVAIAERVLTRFEHSPMRPYGDGVKWIIKCPFNPPDDPHPDDAGAFLIVDGAGKLRAGCHHNRCRKQIEQRGVSGWQWLRQMAGMERRRVMVRVAL